MSSKIRLDDILFLDIETVPQFQSYEQLPSEGQALWNRKAASLSKEETPEQLYGKAGIYSEFGKIICISVGLLITRDEQRSFRVKSFWGHDEHVLLTEFGEMVGKMEESFEKAKRTLYLCAHNGREFDFPYIARRMLILGIPLPKVLQVSGKKPWEIAFLDTLEMWKFGDYKHYTSLNLLAYIFNIPTPKDDIDGSQVATVYYDQQDMDRIVIYCEKDVLTVAQLLLRFRNEPIVPPDCVVRADQ